MNHERLIKRSKVIEGRLAGNIFSTVAIDKDENIIGCGCKKLFNLAQKGYVTLSSNTIDILAVSNNGSVECRSLTPFDYELMPYLAYNGSVSEYNAQKIEYGHMVIATLYRSGKVKIRGCYEAGEGDASWWTDIDDILLFKDGVLGVTKSGNIKMCGTGAKPYAEMSAWKDIALVKQIHNNMVGFSYSGFVGLKKDGTLLYCGDDKAFAEHIITYRNVVSFDGFAVNGQLREFYAILSDGSLQWYHVGNDDILGNFDQNSYKKDYLAVKYLPSGAHFIKLDGTIETHSLHITYPEALKDALITLTGKKYDVVYDAIRTARDNPLSEQVSDWKLFDDPDEVLRRYEGFEDCSFGNNRKCLYCGGDLKGFFGKKCTVCGKKYSGY